MHVYDAASTCKRMWGGRRSETRSSSLNTIRLASYLSFLFTRFITLLCVSFLLFLFFHPVRDPVRVCTPASTQGEGRNTGSREVDDSFKLRDETCACFSSPNTSTSFSLYSGSEQEDKVPERDVTSVFIFYDCMHACMCLRSAIVMCIKEGQAVFLRC
ncbi:hypothetical protein CSUI_006345 [Cystoisospora suis]|uniref:Transmembrane protein n=1 Tax=Cystoisospora suis TaxID=483139 RepID=A0A2C6KH58_9APIC|nr:hypothetical protein CSUI_006345 [Cystoisospora suis]